MNIVIICSDYPYVRGNAESNLLKLQLESIEEIFSNISLIPTVSSRGKSVVSGSKYKILTNFRDIIPIYFYNVFRFYSYSIKDLKSININYDFFISIRRSIIVYLKSVFLFTYLNDYLKQNKESINNTLIYSFWFDDYSFGIYLLKKSFPKIKVISGAHGYDLFAERHPGKRIPFRQISIKLLDKVLVCSIEGKKYLEKQFGNFQNKFYLLNTGISKKHFKVKSSDDGKFRILTLSRTDPIKRLDYLLKILKKIENISDFQIEYYHIGGDHITTNHELKNLKHLSKNLNFEKFKIFFLGKISNEDLNSFFKNNSIDAFLNTSYSEGTSLSLIEAMSYSIPVIVTNVGGNISIGNHCKSSLNIDFNEHQLYEYLKKIHFNNEYREQQKNYSFEYWEKNHNEDNSKVQIKRCFKSFIN